MHGGDKGQTRNLLQSLAFCKNGSQSLKVICKESDLCCVLILGGLMVWIDGDS